MTTLRTPTRRPTRRRRSPRRGPLRGIVLGVTVLVAVPVLALLGLRAARAGVLPGTEVEGVAIGGLSESEAREALDQLARDRGRARIVVEHGDQRVRTRGAALGYALDVEATLARALARGRQSNPVQALTDHLSAFVSTAEIDAVAQIDETLVDDWVAEVGRTLASPPREGRLEFTGALVEPVDPRPGTEVQQDTLAAQVAEAALGGGATLAAPVDEQEPQTTAEDVRDARAAAEVALSGSVTLTRGDVSATLTPEDIGGALRTEVVGEGDDATLDLLLDETALLEAIGSDTIEELDREPESASIELGASGPEVIPGRDGFAFDIETAVTEISDAIEEPGDRTIEAPGEVVEAELTTEEANELQVVEPVGEFTTYHECCETRVTNIHRIADIIDGHLVVPGDTFSVNDFVGERTEEKGFVGGGAIFEGEFVEQIGGGVSQFATTLYNAAWFGGYDIPVSKRHSYYISRYPEGREATLNYPTVDLQITNTSPYGLLIDTSYSDTSITVTIWGKTWVDVESVTGPRTNPDAPGVLYRENDDLKRGETRVIQEAGAAGFDITVSRTLTFPDGRTETDEVFTRYLPQDRIVERNT